MAQLQVHKIPVNTQLYGNCVERQLVQSAMVLKEAVSSSPTALAQLRQMFLPLPKV